MNRQRRREVNAIRKNMLLLERDIFRLQNDEEDAFTSLPDSLQATMRAGTIVGAVEQLQKAGALIQEAAGFLKLEVVFS